MYEKITEDIVGSFNVIKDNPAEVENWFVNEYPRAMIESQLLRPLRDKKVEMDEAHSKMLSNWLSNPRVKEVLKESK